MKAHNAARLEVYGRKGDTAAVYVRLCMFRRSMDAEAQVVKEGGGVCHGIGGVVEHGAKQRRKRTGDQAVEPRCIAAVRPDAAGARAEELGHVGLAQAGKEVEFDDVTGLDPPGEVERRYSGDRGGRGPRLPRTQ